MSTFDSPLIDFNRGSYPARIHGDPMIVEAAMIIGQEWGCDTISRMVMACGSPLYSSFDISVIIIGHGVAKA